MLPAERARLLLFGLLVSLSGCEPGLTIGGYRRDLAPTVDRLVAAYDDLASKRFRVLADFEKPAQGALFRLEPAGGLGRIAISTERAQSKTGVGALKISLVRSSERVVCADSPGSEWGLHRDWSRYHLLLFSVFSPRRLGGFRFSVGSGTDLQLVYAHPRILLNAGWNLIRIDMGDLADHIDLADVRELRFWCDPLDTPTDLYLDDLLLVDNARDVFVSPEQEPGDLYVRVQGRRLVVGALERFELVFSRGQIRQYFDLGHDPARTHNLAGVGSLGPSPVVVPSGVKATVLLDDLSQWAGLGIVAEAYQSLLEATPLRVLVQGEWRFRSQEAPPSDHSPYHRWVYSIYRDGRIYVECSGTARGEHFEPPGLGMVFCCDGDMGFERRVAGGRPAGHRPEIGEEAYVLFSRPQRGQADLLFVPFTPLPVQVLENPNDSRLCVLCRLPTRGDRFTFSAMIRVWPPDIDSPAQAGPLAADYCHPLPIAVDAGRLVRTDLGDFDNDGFSEARGYYVLQLDGNIARVRIDGRRNMRFSPAFRLVDVADRDVWVYVDGREIRDLHRDQDGYVLFEVPGAISRAALLEVTSRPREPIPE